MVALTMAWGCSSSGDDTEANGGSGNDSGTPAFTSTIVHTTEAPDWKIDLNMNDEAPTWTPPDASDFESSMTLLVSLPEPLLPYSTDDDQMAVFVGDECRAVSVRNKVSMGPFEDVYFVLNVRGTASKEIHELLSLRYYSGGAHHLFSLSNGAAYGPFVNEFIKTDGEYVPELLAGNHKYPVKSLAYVVIPSNMPFTDVLPKQDWIGAFINGECRGLCRPGKEMLIMSENMGADVELRYYSSQSNSIYIMKDKVRLRSTSMIMDFMF